MPSLTRATPTLLLILTPLLTRPALAQRSTAPGTAHRTRLPEASPTAPTPSHSRSARGQIGRAPLQRLSRGRARARFTRAAVLTVILVAGRVANLLP